MKSDFEKLMQAKELMTQALECARSSLPENPTMTEARSHMRQAIANIEKVTKKQVKKKQEQQTEHQKWWGTIEANVAEATMTPMSQESYARSLKQLDAMITIEQRKLLELELAVEQKPQQQSLLTG